MTQIILLLCSALASASTSWDFPKKDVPAPAVCASPAPDWIYPVCEDQKKIFTDAIAQARKEKKLLIVEFGATWCPWCKSLHKTMPEVLKLKNANGTKTLADKFVYIGIATSTSDAQKNMQPVESGREVLDLVLGKLGKNRKDTVKGVPFMTIIDPDHPKKTVLEDTGDLEKTTDKEKYGHDPEKIRARLLAAHAKMKAK